MKHGRLIDADALEEKVEHDYHHKKINRYDRDLLLHYLDVEMAPAIEPERKKGKWIDAEWENINTGEKRKGRRCSVCEHGYFRYDVSVNTVSDIPNFCPNCGADMRGEQNENN